MTSHQSTPLAPAGLRAALLRKKALFLGVTAIGATALVSFMAISASPVVTPPPINLSADPLYAATAADKPTMAVFRRLPLVEKDAGRVWRGQNRPAPVCANGNEIDRAGNPDSVQPSQMFLVRHEDGE